MAYRHGEAYKLIDSCEMVACADIVDENAREYSDPDHSESEERFILLGLSRRPRVLVVCHCYREGESVIRIITARKADAKGVLVEFTPAR